VSLCVCFVLFFNFNVQIFKEKFEIVKKRFFFKDEKKNLILKKKICKRKKEKGKRKEW
jgi:hypothetical protein